MGTGQVASESIRTTPLWEIKWLKTDGNKEERRKDTVYYTLYAIKTPQSIFGCNSD